MGELLQTGRTAHVTLAAVVAAGCLGLSACPSFGQEGEGATGREVPVVPLRPDAAPRRSISGSKQFVVYGDSLQTRGAFAVFADAVRLEYLRLFGTEEAGIWVHPIVIDIREDAGPAGVAETARSQFHQVEGGGFRFVVEVVLSESFSRDDLRREIVRALMAEHALRRHRAIPRGDAARLMPDWLFAGILQAMEFRGAGGRPTGLFAAILDGGRLMGTEAVFAGRASAMDSVSLAVFEASSGALVLTLLDQPSGGKRLNRMIEAMADSPRADADLLEWAFPGLRLSRNSIEKWWAVQVAMLAQPTVFELLGPEETDLALERALVLRYPVPRDPGAGSGEDAVVPEGTGEPAGTAADSGRGFSRLIGRLFSRDRGGSATETPASDPPAGDENPLVALAENMVWANCPLSEYPRLMGFPNRAALVQGNIRTLIEVEQRGSPLLRPVIRGYQSVFERIVDGKVDGLEVAIADLDRQRAEMLGRAGEIDDFLNWYEATQIESRSGAFAGYRRAWRTFSRSRSERADGISRYLDAVENELKP